LVQNFSSYTYLLTTDDLYLYNVLYTHTAPVLFLKYTLLHTHTQTTQTYLKSLFHNIAKCFFMCSINISEVRLCQVEGFLEQDALCSFFYREITKIGINTFVGCFNFEEMYTVTVHYRTLVLIFVSGLRAYKIQS